jgi:hypothetical protein
MDSWDWFERAVKGPPRPYESNLANAAPTRFTARPANVFPANPGSPAGSFFGTSHLQVHSAHINFPHFAHRYIALSSSMP